MLLVVLVVPLLLLFLTCTVELETRLSPVLEARLSRVALLEMSARSGVSKLLARGAHRNTERRNTTKQVWWCRVLGDRG